jgi:hypothetical protein
MEFSAFNFLGRQRQLALLAATASVDLSGALQLQLDNCRSARADVDVDFMAVLGQLRGDGSARAPDLNKARVDPEGVAGNPITTPGEVEMTWVDSERLAGMAGQHIKVYHPIPSVFISSP